MKDYASRFPICPRMDDLPMGRVVARARRTTPHTDKIVVLTQHGLMVPWRDYERTRAALARADAREARTSRFWVAWWCLALVVALVLIFGCSPAPSRSWGDMACEARDTTQTEEVSP